MAKQTVFNRFIIVLRLCFWSLGILFVVLIALCFTTLPYRGYYWLGTSQSKITEKPDYIVLLGGSGMPSESNLMRAFFVYRAATESPESQIVISIPGNTADPNSTARRIANELVRKGINQERILYAEIGTNTRSQAMQLLNFNSENMVQKSLLLVTSPEHMRRAVLVFEKAGFKRVNALPSFENSLEGDLVFNDDELGGHKTFVPDIGSNLLVRYEFWTQLKYEILIAREIAALGYYRLRGWI